MMNRVNQNRQYYQELVGHRIKSQKGVEVIFSKNKKNQSHSFKNKKKGPRPLEIEKYLKR